MSGKRSTKKSRPNNRPAGTKVCQLRSFSEKGVSFSWGTDTGGVKLKSKDKHFLDLNLLIAQFFAADAAKIGFRGVAGFPAVGAFLVLVGGFVKGARHLYRDNAGGDGQDAVAQYHNKGGDEFAEVGQGHNVAIAHRGKGDDGPVDAQRNAVETVLTVFDDVHETAEHGHQNDDEHHEYEYFAGASAQGQHQQVAGAYKVVEFEDAVNAQEAHGTDDDEGLGIGRHAACLFIAANLMKYRREYFLVAKILLRGLNLRHSSLLKFN